MDFFRLTIIAFPAGVDDSYAALPYCDTDCARKHSKLLNCTLRLRNYEALVALLKGSHELEQLSRCVYCGKGIRPSAWPQLATGPEPAQEVS